MQVLASDAILVTDSTPVTFNVLGSPTRCNVAIAFYSDADGTAGLGVGSGTRNVSVRQTIGNDAGAKLEFAFDNGSIVALPGRTFASFKLAAPAGAITITAAPNLTPPTAISYRIWLAC